MLLKPSVSLGPWYHAQCTSNNAQRRQKSSADYALSKEYTPGQPVVKNSILVLINVVVCRQIPG